MTDTVNTRVRKALSSVVNARTGMDVVAGEQVRGIASTADGRVRLTLLLDPADDPTIARDVRRAVESVEGVSEARVDVDAPGSRPAGPGAASGAAATTGAPARRNPLPVVEHKHPHAPRVVPPPTPRPYPTLGRIIAVSSGKGGVGKSTVTVNLAAALAARGRYVGLMDADVYGPDVPRMMGASGQPRIESEKIVPLEAHGVKLMSLGFLVERDQPAIWRGPIVTKMITQFLRDVLWGRLDYLLVDMPPGTGDAQLTLVQSAELDGAIIVTTPQEVAVGDALRGAKMFERVKVPVMGIVENMSWYEAPGGERLPLFGAGGGARLALELGVPLLGEVPLVQAVREGGDVGIPIVVSAPDSAAARTLAAIAEAIDRA